MSKKRRWVQWLPAAAALCGAVIACLRLPLEANGSGTAIGFLIALGTVAALFLAIAVRNALRENHLARRHPGAVTFTIVGYDQLAEQLTEVSRTLHLDDSRIRWRGYYNALIDESTVSIFGGIFLPTLSFCVPRERVATVSVVRADQGGWKLLCVQLQMSTPSPLVIDLCPMEIVWGYPFAIRKRTVYELATKLESGLRK